MLILLDIIILLILAYISYEDYKTTIVPSQIVFLLLFLVLLKNILVFKSNVLITIISIILSALLTILGYILYKKFEQKELKYPVIFLGLVGLLAIIDYLFLHQWYYVYLFALSGFGVMAYYIKSWAMGDTFAFIIFSMYLLTFYPFSCKIPEITNILLSYPLQFTALTIVVLSYIPYIMFISVKDIYKKDKSLLAEKLANDLVSFSLIMLIILQLSKNLPIILIVCLGLTISFVISYILNKLKFKRSSVIKFILSIILISLIIIFHKENVLLFTLSLILFIVLSLTLYSITKKTSVKYIRVDELADADIPLFYLIKSEEGYIYSEKFPKLKENFEVLIRKKNPNGLYPSQIRLLKELKKQNIVPEFVPIATGVPLLPAFFIAAIVTFILFGILI